ncbi:MAG: FtsX-like permease family protein, partial [Dehalococcoidia bacterium]
MSLLHLAYVIARRRIVSAWRLELVLFVGILLSVALLSSSVVFSDLLAEAALRRALQEAPPEQSNFLVRVFNDLEDPTIASQRTSLYQNGINFVDNRVTARFQPFLENQAHLLETATFFFSGHDQLELPNESRPRGRLQYLNGTPEQGHLRLMAGQWPGEPAPPGDFAARDLTLEIAVDKLGADLLQLGLGQEFFITPAASVPEEPTIRVKIVGIFEVDDADSDFWHGRENNFSHSNDQWSTIPMFTSQGTILEYIGRVYPGIYTNVTWIFDLDREGVQAGDVNDLQTTIRSVKLDVISNLQNSSITIRLDRVLSRYSEQLLLSRIPLFLMVFLVTGILAYYLALMAGLVVRSRSAEISMLKSRGSTTLQIGLLVLIEGLLLAAPAVILGTLAAPLVAGVLGSLFFEVEGAAVPIVLSARAFLLGLGGALLAIVVLTVSTLVASRQGIVEFRQSGARPPTRPFLHRYYIDFLLLALIGFLWWQIGSRDTFLVQPLGARGLQIDFTLLLVPVLLLLGLGLLVLRLFPWLIALSALAIEPIGPAWLVQSMRRISRDPIIPGSLVVLLMLATALGVIGAAFTATLERSQQDRATYEVGADLRLIHNGDSRPFSSYGLSTTSQDTSAHHQAEALRTNSNLLTRGFSASRVATLAVDTGSFAQAAWFRPDFAGGRSLAELMSSIRPEPATASDRGDGLALPPEATHLAVWGNPGRPGSRLVIRARLRDARGYYFDAPLGELESREWQRLEGELKPLPPPRRGRLQVETPLVTPPFTLVALQVSSQSGSREPGIVFLQDLSAVTPSGEQALTDFQELGDWQVIEDYSRPGLYALELSEAATRPERSRSVAFSWAPGGIGLRGIWAGEPERPIPVMVDPSFMEEAEAEIGDNLNLSISTYAVPIQVASVADFFPTLDPRQQSFLVMDLAQFIEYANRHSRRVIGGPNELWSNTAAGAGALPVITDGLVQRGLRVQETRVASEEVDRRVRQPLTNASWGGLLVLMFLALVLASASGVVLFSYLDT